MNIIEELEALQNFANKFNLTVCLINLDKRKKQKYVLVNSENISVSNNFTYDEMNIFLIGILRANKFRIK